MSKYSKLTKAEREEFALVDAEAKAKKGSFYSKAMKLTPAEEGEIALIEEEARAKKEALLKSFAFKRKCADPDIVRMAKEAASLLDLLNKVGVKITDWWGGDEGYEVELSDLESGDRIWV